ncbi:fatty acid desaturase family protein [Streptomyces sp. NPDC002328]|uniref:fatty acid desaturase family protein n=1 Tax=Streptomyces sp. NPDC002328 TaxID=3364642 RepID=UPI003675C01F
MEPATGGTRRKGNPGSPHLPSIVSEDGVRWVDYRKTLKPRYGIVWRDIGLCHLALVAGLLAVPVASRTLPAAATAALVVPAACWIGYWMHSLFLFGHEAAHTNLASSRKLNDRLGDWCVWILYGSTTVNYRYTHMTHHAHLGDHEDTETTYHLCLSVLNMLKAVTGIHVLEVLLRKRGHSEQRKNAGRTSSRTSSGLLASLRSFAVHAAIVAGLLLAGHPLGALTWLVAVGAVFPLLATVRTVVEHRHLEAPCDVDFTVETHGPVNRLFGTGPVSRTFGSAGFNQHLLHHWDPAISYTRFPEMGEFLSRTPLAAEMDASRIGYGTAIRTLIREARHG